MVNKVPDGASIMVYWFCHHDDGSDLLESWKDYTSSSYLE